MAGFFSRFNPLPRLPSYPGPYSVGSLDVEIPIVDINSSLVAPAPHIKTVQFRIFYPCEPGTGSKTPVRWLPDPEREYQQGFTQFLGVGPTLANISSYAPSPFKYTSLPVNRDALPLLPPGDSKQWPVFVFSHGLGGTRNMYSHLVGSMASHGFIAIAIEHRDGSAARAVMQSLETGQLDPTVLLYKRYPFERTKEIDTARNEQLQIRLWECALLYESLRKIAAGNLDRNILQLTSKLSDKSASLRKFKNLFDVNTPGAISWCGHSFGAATIVQFVKSIFYHNDFVVREDSVSLFISRPSEALVEQITSDSPVILLDLWTLPLENNPTKHLFDRPLPCHTSNNGNTTTDANLLVILSENFRKWKGNLVPTCRLISRDPAASLPSAIASDSATHFYFLEQSAHLSQSDVGVLFPLLTARYMQAPEPERLLNINIKAIVQLLRARIRSEEDTNQKKRDEDMFSPSANIRGWVKLDLTDEQILTGQRPSIEAEATNNDDIDMELDFSSDDFVLDDFFFQELFPEQPFVENQYTETAQQETFSPDRSSSDPSIPETSPLDTSLPKSAFSGYTQHSSLPYPSASYIRIYSNEFVAPNGNAQPIRHRYRPMTNEFIGVYPFEGIPRLPNPPNPNPNPLKADRHASTNPVGFESVPKCEGDLPLPINFPFDRKQFHYLDLTDLCSFSGKRRHTAIGQLSRNLGCACAQDAAGHSSLVCHAPPISDHAFFGAEVLRTHCYTYCGCPNEPRAVPTTQQVYEDNAPGEIFHGPSGDFAAYAVDGKVKVWGKNNDGTNDVSVLVAPLANQQKAASAQADKICSVSLARPAIPCPDCGGRCRGPKDCSSSTRKGCRCLVARKPRNRGPFHAVCGLIAPAASRIMGKRSLEEMQYACACNATYVSVGCCGSDNGIISEHPTEHLGVLA
ncbi:MAG: hypothetical protein M1814_000886 [Vezdaea aestivalis]|nr:MAG: hypothetical protein M1814_000886 [Vezdaea aestivalis]